MSAQADSTFAYTQTGTFCVALTLEETLIALSHTRQGEFARLPVVAWSSRDEPPRIERAAIRPGAIAALAEGYTSGPRMAEVREALVLASVERPDVLMLPTARHPLEHG